MLVTFSQPADAGSFSETSDGGFLIGGHTTKPGSPSGEDAALMKLSADGTVQFVSLIGGIHSEGSSSYGPTGSVATPLGNDGYGIAISSTTYVTAPAGEDFRQKADWWLVKTDANRKIRNFNDVMVDLDPGSFVASASTPQSPVTLSYLTDPSYSAGPITDTAPAFNLVDLTTRTGVDLPSLVIQASSPRIISNHHAEAIVEQHFSYHTLVAFFPDPTQVTYSATGLPQDFVIDPQTGVISGIAHVGSETVENNLPPIPIIIQATDGIDTAEATVNLAISDGAPVLSVNDSPLPAYPDPSATPVPDQADKVLSFAAAHPGKQTGRIMNVEATTTPENAASWQRIDNGSNGYMTYDISCDQYSFKLHKLPETEWSLLSRKADRPGQDGFYFQRGRAI